MSTTQTIQFQATAEFRQQMETEAARLHLSLSAYILYLHSRIAQARETARLDRHVREFLASTEN